MAQNQLRDFFRDKKQKATPAGIDWIAKRDAWVKAVEDLYSRIENDYLKGAKDEVEIVRADKVIMENFVGEYHVPELILRVGEEHVIFSPKGTNIVGAHGRVDLRGDRGESNLIWQGDERWSVVLSRVPTLQLVPLTAESLEQTLRRVMRP